MSTDTFVKLASAIQALAVALALIIGGIWALFRFRFLRELDRARAELDHLRQQLRTKATITMSLHATPMPAAEGLGRTVLVQLDIKNVGNAPTTLNWSEARLKSARVVGFKDEVLVLRDWVTTRLTRTEEFETVTIESGDAESVAFVVPAPVVGLYHIEFSLPGAPSDALNGLEEFDDFEAFHYSVLTYVVVN
jgi:hypothetical protein